MTPPLYIVWRRSPAHCHRIWLDAHFKGAGLAPPPPDAPDVLYYGADYPQAYRTALQANLSDPRWTIKPVVRSPESGASAPPSPLQTPDSPLQTPIPPSLFG
jgi:hypothetical protein